MRSRSETSAIVMSRLLGTTFSPGRTTIDRSSARDGADAANPLRAAAPARRVPHGHEFLEVYDHPA